MKISTAEPMQETINIPGIEMTAAFPSKMGRGGLDFRGAYFGRVAFVEEENQTPRPIHSGFFGAVG